LTHVVKTFTPLDTAPWIAIFPVRTPTLPPATHTNVYALRGSDGLWLIDPASPYREEQALLDAALEALKTPVVEIVLTHHHLDHVSGAAHLAERLGVGVAAHAETASRLRGRLEVTRIIQEGDLIADSFVALHTPGHAPGHLCFHDRRVAGSPGALIAGDMIASIGTIIVEPDDGGDMAEYLDQLRRLRALGAAPLLPAHGPPVEDAAGKLDFYVKHRLEREARVAAALGTWPQAVEELVPPAYPDVPPHIWPLAARSLLAHLYKLEKEGRAQRAGDRWIKTP
jgi:glyoxylase-like metal-dependent hydrolase (beta-lactamase superfamily II)